MFDTEEVGVSRGLDAGKNGHGLTQAGKKVFDKTVAQQRAKVAGRLQSWPRRSAPSRCSWTSRITIGGLPLAVARNSFCRVVYLPGLATRRIADLYLGRRRSKQGHVPVRHRLHKRRPRLWGVLRHATSPREKSHQALSCLAGQRISVLFTMLSDGTFYEPRTPQ